MGSEMCIRDRFTISWLGDGDAVGACDRVVATPTRTRDGNDVSHRLPSWHDHLAAGMGVSDNFYDCCCPADRIDHLGLVDFRWAGSIAVNRLIVLPTDYKEPFVPTRDKSPDYRVIVRMRIQVRMVWVIEYQRYFFFAAPELY